MGLGTVTSIDIKQEKKGSLVRIFGNFTTGTSTATSVSMTMPTGYVASSIYGSITMVGEAIAGTASAVSSKDLSVLATAGSNLLNFSVINSTTVDPLTAQNGSTVFNNSTKYSIDVMVEIQGWTSGAATPGVVMQNVPAIFTGTQSSQAVTANTTNITLK